MLAVALLLGAFWFRGRSVSDTLRANAGSGVTLHAFSGNGSVAFAVTEGGEYFKEKKDWWAYSESRPPIDFHTRWTNLGNETRFSGGGFVVIREPTRGTIFGLLVPCVPLAQAVALVALTRVAYWRLYARRRARILAGLCPACGHEIRGLTERCPGCGRPRTRGTFRGGFRIGMPSDSRSRPAA